MLSIPGLSAHLGKAHMKRIGSLLFAAVLLFSGIGCSSLRSVAASYIAIPLYKDREAAEHAHTDLSFFELSADASDLSLEIERTKELLFRIDTGELSGHAAQKVLEQRIDAFHRLRTAASIAYVRYCFDVTDAAQRESYEQLSTSLNALGCLLIEAERTLCRDPALSAVYDADTIAQIEKEASLHNASTQALTEREQGLIGAYDALTAMTVSYAGREWSREEILSDPTLNYETFSTLFRLYRHAYNEQAGAIYLDLIQTRNEIAQTLGFESYVEYAYATYERDYTPEDALALAETVKRELVPVFTELQEGFYDATMRLGCGTFKTEQTVQSVGTAIVDLLPEFSKPWDYMFSHELYDFGSSETRQSGSFTTYFETYGAPFLFTSWDDS